MLQKMNWMRCLLIGISIFIGLFLNSCDKGEVDHVVKLDYYYINKTNVPIRIKTFEFEENGFDLKKDYKINENDTLYIPINTEGPPNIEVTDILQPVLFSDSTVVIYNQIKCEIVGVNTGVNNIENYNSTEIENNYFQLEYVFTNEQFQNAEDCD